MGKIFVMRTTRTGSVKVGESVNSGKTPTLFLGLKAGACGNLTPDEKTAFNEAAGAQGGDMFYCRADKLSAWSFANGVHIEVEHRPGGYGFRTRIV